MSQNLKKKIVNWLLPKMVNSVVVEDVISYDNRNVYLAGSPVTAEELKVLKEEAKFIAKTRLWSVMMNTLSFKALERIGEKSVTFDDVWSGKMMLLNIELQKEILQIMKNIEIRKPTEIKHE